MSKAASAPLGLAISGRAVALSLCLVAGPSSQAADQTGRDTVQVAAASIEAAPGSASNRRARERSDLEWLLAQNGPSAEPRHGDLILVEVADSAPQSVDEDVAREHRLVLVKRLTLGGSGKRIVAYRVSDGRSAADVVAALKRDRRVSSAQANVVYGLAPAVPAPSAPSDAKPPPGVPDKQAERQASRQENKGNRPASGQRPTAAARAAAVPNSGATRALVTNKHANLRWPTADEPFVNIGVTHR
jgi:hypothetical protein